MTSLVFNCIGETTAHGIPRIVESGSKTWKRCIWFLLSLGGFSCFTLVTLKLLTKFNKEETLLSTTFAQLPFHQPDIHICPNQAFSESYFLYPPTYDLPYMKQIKDEIEQFQQKLTTIYQNKLNYLLTTNLLWGSVGIDKLYRAFSFKVRQTIPVLICNDKPIFDSEKVVKIMMNSDNLVCFVITNSTCKLETPYSSIKLVLYSENYHKSTAEDKFQVFVQNVSLLKYHLQRLPLGTEELDFLIYLTPRNSLPWFSSKRLYIKSGQGTSISISSSMVKRIKHTKFNCSSSSENELAEYHNMLTANPRTIWYSKVSACYIEAMQMEIYKRYNCYHHAFPIRASVNLSSADFCFNISSKTFDLTRGSRIISMLKRIGPKIYVECTNSYPCHYFSFDTSVSSNNYPSFRLLRNLVRGFSNDFPGLSELKNETLNSSDIELILWRNNLLKLTLTPEDFNSSKVEETLVYAEDSLASDIGGIMGFFLGASLLTVSEIIVLILDLLEMLKVYIGIRIGWINWKKVYD